MKLIDEPIGDVKRKLYIHIGPHKTGTTSIQDGLSRSAKDLEECGVYYHHNEKTHAAAQHLAKRRFIKAEAALKDVARDLSQISFRAAILSQEDFSGDLPGRDGGGGIYPELSQRLRILRRSFSNFEVTFVFFEREPVSWIKSCYRQNVRYRSDYHSLDGFSSKFQFTNWDVVLREARKEHRGKLVVLPYTSSPGEGFNTILALAGVPPLLIDKMSSRVRIKNRSLRGEELIVYELINRRAVIRSLIPIYKERASALFRTERPFTDEEIFPVQDKFPKDLSSGEFKGLAGLTERVRRRVGNQENQPNLLPSSDVDLLNLAAESMPSDTILPEVSRGRMEDQYRILEYHLRNGSKLAFLNALVISYLRRDTPHTNLAKEIFHRIWQECGIFLVTELSTRWILSTLQTFMDHPDNSAQRVVGATGYFYGNMLKIYEGERALMGIKPDARYIGAKPSANSGFRGMDQYSVGGTDLLLNTNAMALEVAATDPVSGLVLEELLLRTKHSKTVFSRSDAARKQFAVNQRPFLDVWSFFEEPKSQQ
ncbi:hypothetical protein [Paracoccus sp. (in: a-proteobacteria)]|uniref:hypothetical protein n=1 Tax=Paracoccus sp. TaxID=267 RepID=UPI00289B9F2B|nr:hypothetical protein [Paracoccus sp. (in: a-proteobacteria)]